MLFKFLFNILKNLRWVITLALIGVSLFYAASQYQSIKSSPLGALLPNIAIPTLPPVFNQIAQTPSSKAAPTPTTLPRSIKVLVETTKGTVTFQAETAKNEDERALGLMYRTKLPQYAGMYFLFDTDVQYGFWMKNCEIPLDMLFINVQGVIVDVKENIRPCKELNPKQDACPSYTPKELYRSVLEINGGSSKLNNITVGQKVTISNN